MSAEAIRVALVITAAGSSSRFETGEKKEFLPLQSAIFPKQNGGSVLSCSAEPFLQFFLNQQNYILKNLTITIPSQNAEPLAKAALLSSPFIVSSLHKLCIEPYFVVGSNTRQASVFCALKNLQNTTTNIDIALIHDAARPFTSVNIVKEVVTMAYHKGAAVPAIRPVDTQKEIDSKGKIIRHLVRSSLGAVQTPQGFRFNDLFLAHEKASVDSNEYTDDTEIWDQYIGEVYAVEGSEKNKKITFKHDMENTMIENIVYRTGIGTDFHRLEKGRKLFIGGIEIPFEKGEVAHSDGDVLLHAITDSLLGAAGLGDIGELFPPSDKTWKDADSKLLLRTAWEKVQQESWEIQNIDCVIHMEQPKFLPWREKVIESIASVLGCEQQKVFVKAKTQEGLGDIGQGNAISAQVICLLKK